MIAQYGTTGEAELRIAQVSHSFGVVNVLKDVSAEVGRGEFLTLLGASGSGKTTLLRIIGGLIRPDAGSIHLSGRDITGLPPERRDIGFVFQNYALFPHLSVADNVAFSLRVRKVETGERQRRIREALELVGLARFADRFPGQLSGGQQQRVALARALVFRPGVLLLDEPLGALDRQLRQQLAVELRALQRRTGMTMVYVTHDQEEAFTMSTQVAVMREGVIEQLATPHEIYSKPANLTVAQFLGELNCFRGRVIAGAPASTAVDADIGPIVSAQRPDLPAGTPVMCAVRPEHVRVVTAHREGASNRLPARVRTVIFGGSWHRLELVLPKDGSMMRTEGRGEPEGIEEGSEVEIAFDPERVMLFRED